MLDIHIIQDKKEIFNAMKPNIIFKGVILIINTSKYLL